MTRSRKRREDVNREEANQSVCTRPKKRPEENPEGEVDEVINRPEGKGSKRRKEFRPVEAEHAQQYIGSDQTGRCYSVRLDVPIENKEKRDI